MNFTLPVNRPQDTYVIGRNGVTQVQGLEILHGADDNVVLLTPMGKRGLLNAGFSIPIETMDKMCSEWLKNRDPKELKKSLKNP
jgi:hypothetical protein